jgi:hypothetical protein
MTEDRTWERQGPRSDAALVDPGVTFDRTTEAYKEECRKALRDSSPED